MIAKRKFNEQEENSNDSNDSIQKSKFQNVNNKLNDLNKDTSVSNSSSSNVNKSIIENKIRKIIEVNFDEEINYKKYELDKINERIFEAQNMLDKLRVCIICNYYSLNGRLSVNEYMNHPAVSGLKCEHLESTIMHCKNLISNLTNNTTNLNDENSQTTNDGETIGIGGSKFSNLNQQQFDVKICVGNVSKYLNSNNLNSNNQTTSNKNYSNDYENLESSQYNQDLITHKWMVYIRSPNCLKLDNYIKKVIFYLHSSYKPYDMVEVKSPPFQLVRRGWGEFPIHAQIHFKDPRNKRADINHNLKLDWTQTGLQTFGGETSISLKLVIKPNDFINDNYHLNKSKNSNITINQEESALLNQSTPIQQKLTNENTSNEQNFQQEIISTSLSNELNSIYSIDSSNQIYEQPEVLKQDLSSSSSCSISNSSSALISKTLTNNVNNSNGTDLSPSSFISTEIETQTIFSSNKTNQSQSSSTNQETSFDELIMNFCSNNQSQTKKQEDKPISKPTGPSIDELLNLRPKSIQLFKPPMASVSLRPTIATTINKQITTTIVIPKVSQSTSDSTVKPTTTVQQSTIVNSFQAPKVSNSIINQLANKPLVNNSASNSNILESLNKKTTVIYKIGSEDVKKDSTINININNKQTSSILNLNLETCLNNTNKQKDLLLNNINNNNNKSEFQSQATASSTQSTLNLNKKVKLTLDQLTKIKNNSIKNSSKLDESQSNKQQQQQQNEEITINNQSKEQDQKQEQTIVDKLKHDKEQSKNINSDSFYSVQRLISQINSSGLKVECIKFESLIKQALKYYPIIYNLNYSHIHKKSKLKNKLPFAAQTIHEYYSWPYAKRKANEWIRALHIKRKCTQLLNTLGMYFNLKIDIDIWSTKSIVLWLRSHGYTPLEYQHMQVTTFDHLSSCLKINMKDNENYCDLNYVNSLMPWNRLFDTNSLILSLNNVKKNLNDEELEEENIMIDVVNIDQLDEIKQKNKKDFKTENSFDSTQANEFNLNHIEMCSGSKYVREQLDMLNLKTGIFNIEPTNERPNETNLFTCNLVEKFMFALVKRFAEDLIRQTCSDMYYDSTKSNNNNNNTNNSDALPSNIQIENANVNSKKPQNETLLYQKFPQNINVLDVYNTIHKHDQYDFLTNKYMASWSDYDQSTLKESNTNEASNSSIIKPTQTNSNNKENGLIGKSEKNSISKSNLKRNYSDSSFNKY